MTELSKNLMCVQMRSGVEVWVENERIGSLKQVLANIDGTKFINIDEQVLNTADIVGIFSPNTMTEHIKRKNGQWQCKEAYWHDRGDKCECKTRTQIEAMKKKAENHEREKGFKPLSDSMFNKV